MLKYQVRNKKECLQDVLSLQKKTKIRARLVVRGFEEEFCVPVESPDVGKGGIKNCLAMTASKH